MTVAEGCWVSAVGAEAEAERLTQGQPPFFNSTRKKEVLTRCKPGESQVLKPSRSGAEAR